MEFSFGRSATTLPPNDYNDYETRTAYDHCLWLEQFHSWSVFVEELRQTVSEEIMKDMPPVTVARVLGYAIHLAPNDNGRDALVRDILACEKDPELLAGVAHLYVYGLCRIFYNPKGPTPCVSTSQTPRLSLEAIAADKSLLSQSFSDIFDHEMKTAGGRSLLCGFERTTVAHIISQSLSENISGSNAATQAKFEWARTAGAMLQHFGGFKAYDLDNEILHSPKNVFTASQNPHLLFEALSIWLTPVKDVHTQAIISNTYKLNHYYGDEYVPHAIPCAKPEVKFTGCTINGTFIPPPDPWLLALHAACAGVTNMSGVVGYLEEYFWDMKSIAVMTEPLPTSKESHTTILVGVWPSSGR
ncbi:hypothetical protein BDY19DRAFT_1060986 [Irpex rosettiformis]|uniref:Uncharacterized protein n=1 Tax=Irpex rosettiformis TaxID=378272 RepID=A0ACB8TMX7_9APHY|nr:hypothetical protein BDY19DRAFT_1060986 [Irpex rosettiformis]